MQAGEAGAALARLLTNVAKYSVLLGAGGTLANTTLYNVDGGERAVVFDRFRGILEETTGEGTHIAIPWVQKPNVMDIRTRPRSIASSTGTKDLQMVNLSLRVLTRPDETKLPKLFQQYGTDWDERVLPSISNEVLKSVVAQYNAEQLLTKRNEVSAKVAEALRKRSADFGIVMEDVAITHLSFGTEFAKAIEQKQVAEQEAERAKYLVMKADQERKAAIIRAEGESEAAKMISDATKAAGLGFIELRRIEAARDIASTMSKAKNVVYLPPNQNTLIGLNTGST